MVITILKMSVKQVGLVAGAVACLLQGAQAQKKKDKPLSSKKDYLVTIGTAKGNMVFVLSDKTPRHKQNFVTLAKEGFYDGLLFHRVIENFMIQGGDPGSKEAPAGVPLGSGTHGERIPAEFDPALFHKHGALAAARDNNPEKASSGCQFYIVQGKKWTETELEKQLARAARKPSQAQKSVYLKEGGVPHLDGNYTVFGEVIGGAGVIDQLASVATDERDRPEENLAMKVKVEVWKKKKISKKYNYAF